ncbi:PREDICTED: protein-tyrosine-phosphatase MKP1 [Tarenaya hassleriana]|uniref:protein-tyrosine-phosphatase MKP1 n=1 Tax=Tarenaya hassleriana TaxID=28532 RepID=UPI00053C80BE|nr:PREDICTED: protein-tyrosine-phosphatase MKP1 [Tarenaya hassleriana]XP_010554588.1 PREDICTED: protein-tyrosine-phosphatase MKP1 [Tarenaya hassleriana]XP_010554589.1 PREDICTED: protein-tyrosine-phosphatase MKP1 [Tarenaya hassleriana]
MVGREDVASNGQAPPGSKRMFWRSASWSASRTASQNPENEEQHLIAPIGSSSSSGNGPNRRCPAAPLTPRSQQNSKARACLPPLQPLSIARRSLDEWPKAGSDDLGEWPHPPTPSGNKTGERLKLDLSSTQRILDKGHGQAKRDKIALFDKECSKVAEHIYLGGDAVAKDKDILKQNGITHILNCVGFVCPEYFKSDFVYRTLWLQDSPSEDITSILYDVFDYFEDVREQKGRIFVHCCQGVSRSTSLVIAYLMWREGQNFDDAFQYVKSARGIADPNMGFACQLLQCQKRVHAFPLSPTSLLRMYRMSPHSPYDPLHLVPKLLNDPSPSSLDSRGAFIIQIPSAIYIWVGTKCEDIVERDARAAVCQIVRYEKVEAPISVIREGMEPAYFWDAFMNMLPMMDKSGERDKIGELLVKTPPGNKKVDTYNVDFEIVQKAIVGGFVPPFASCNDENETHLPARESSWSSLKCKFASRFEKTSMTVTRPPLSRMYSDSMMIVHALSPASTSSSSSSASHPYLSVKSVSADSSTNPKNVSEPSGHSSLSSSCPLSPSSTLPNLSNLSLCPSQTSPNESSFLGSCGVDNSLQPRIEPFTDRKVSPSLAERRGSLSKSLKLPVLTDSNRGKIPSGRNLCQAGSIDIVFNLEGVGNGDVDPNSDCAERIPSARIIDSMPQKEMVSLIDCSEPEKHCRSGQTLGSVLSHTTGNYELGDCNLRHPVACWWPSMDRITKFRRSDLDSKSVIVVSSQSDIIGQTGRVLHIWIGSSFENNQSQIDSNNKVSNTQKVDWVQVGNDILRQMDLPKDTPVKIMREGEELTCFLALLSAL